MKKVLAAAGALVMSTAVNAAVPQIPVETLFGTNYVRSATISPDGTKVAFLAPSGETYGIAVLDLATHKVTLPIHIEDENVNSVTWKGNDRLIFSGIISGIESGPQVASTDVEGKHVFSILQAQKDKMIFSIYSGGIISMRREDPGHIFIYGYTLESDFKQDGGIRGAELIMKVNVVNGQRTLVTPADEGDTSSTLGDFGVDHQGRVRTARRVKGLSSELVYRDDTTGPWRTIRTFPAEHNAWAEIGFQGDGGNGVYIIDKESSDTGSLRLFDPATGTLGPALFTPVDGEIDSLIFSPDGKRLLGLRYTTEKVHYHWFEPKYANLQTRLEASFPGEAVALASISDDEKRILVRTYSDRELGAYYLLDLNKGSMGIVTTAGPKINRENMAQMTPISFVSRDGLTIHGYLTLPLDFVPGKPGPLIVHPHGGPFGIRDDWGFDPEVQLLANRGYAVLQVNYRGSGGYGKSFLFAGYREWGGKMQDDLTDSVKWAIDKGYADPHRVAIFGASYGG
ncbi:MAG TPA: prolyl oligopeptidase family serine peptidase, partial [Opitutaceae bacterium]